MKLNGKLVAVTGASSGIGAATAKAMAREGARVVLMARTREALDAVAREIVAAGGQAHAVPVDAADAGAVARAAERVRSDHELGAGVPDVIVHSAGVGRLLFIDETSPEEFLQMNAVPYHAAFFVTKAFLPGMLARGSGAIVVVNSPATLTGMVWPGALGYIATRWALRGFTEALRADLRGTGLTVTSIMPGKVATEYHANNPGSEERIPRLNRIVRTLTAPQTAEVIVNAVRRERREVVVPFMVRLTAVQARYLPRLTSWLLARTGPRRADIDAAEVERSSSALV